MRPARTLKRKQFRESNLRNVTENRLDPLALLCGCSIFWPIFASIVISNQFKKAKFKFISNPRECNRKVYATFLLGTSFL